jgi:hypothetical protein
VYGERSFRDVLPVAARHSARDVVELLIAQFDRLGPAY